MNLRTGFLLTFLLAMMLPAANAQDTRDDEADVLLTIERLWEAERKGDQDRVDEMLTDNFMAWGKSSPAPRAKGSRSSWARIGEQVGRMIHYELYPLSITVEGDTAIAHYLYSSAFKPKDGSIEMSNGRYTDILVRTDNGWRFIAWHGGDD